MFISLVLLYGVNDATGGFIYYYDFVHLLPVATATK